MKRELVISKFSIHARLALHWSSETRPRRYRSADAKGRGRKEEGPRSAADIRIAVLVC